MKKTVSVVAAVIVLVLLAVTAGSVFLAMREPVTYDGVGIIHGPDGEEIRRAGVQIIPYENRGQASEEIEKEMEDAYKQIYEKGDLALSIPEVVSVLEELGLQYSAEDLILQGIFHVVMSEEDRAMLAQEGTTITMTFDLGDTPVEHVIAMHYIDGVWNVIAPEHVKILEDGQVEVTFETDIQTVAFLVIPGEEKPVPSPSQGGTPGVDGVDDGQLVVTPYVSRGEASGDVETVLEDAYGTIVDAQSLDQAVVDLEKTLKELRPDLDASDLVVRDLFYVTLGQDTLEALEAERDRGVTITVEFELGLAKEDLVIVMCYRESGWEIIPVERVRYLENGNTGVEFDEDVGVIAFIVEESE